ncbi:hypothetical protein KRE43_12160 [Elizabethkingia meningoseptica]|nr:MULTISPECIES: hypothetical protein [Weeksellaceae]MCT3806348.1 hypothetical protein [Elizabethkingia anophelis]MCT3813662.1 hypothetical protein [Elizabethkingia anophelis]MCT3820756.1 hypothetical protein [Elizabethkingia anophelis]MCT3927000.1 hypothetical protein [Elizabethkingia anophelis]MCT4101614.1 hypothetical protein [Elizabethkingia anophelis]
MNINVELTMTDIKNNERNKGKNALVNKYLCNFIASRFLLILRDQNGKEISQNKYAKLCGIAPSTVSKIKLPEGYDIPMSTIYNICRHEKKSLQSFFSDFEKIYGQNIPD